MVYVGKQKGFHTRTQDEIHALLCRFAHAGATVLRLKGGDPYIFGRGGEEAQYLRDRGINVHCVPGARTRVAADPRSAACCCPHLPLVQLLCSHLPKGLLQSMSVLHPTQVVAWDAVW